MNKKRKVLFITENASLLSGFGTYGEEVLKRLHATNKYDLAEFASYCKPQDSYVRNRPWPVYANAPSGKDKKEEKFFNNSDINQFGLWRFDRVCLDFKPDVVCCFPSNTMVMTDCGYQPIELIKKDNIVLTHKNRLQKVTTTFRRQFKGDLIYIYVNGNAEPLKVTPEHPIFIYKKRKQTNQKKSCKAIYQDIMPEWVKAQDLRKGDLVTLTPNQYHLPGKAIIDVTSYLYDFIIQGDKVYQKRVIGIPRHITLDENFAKLLGYYIADGYSSKTCSTLNITFHTDKEQRFIGDVRSLFFEKFGLSSNNVVAKDKRSTAVTIYNKLLNEFFRGFIGEPKNKKIPRQIFSSNNEIKASFLSGLFRGDGCYKKNTVSLTTVYRKLAYNVRLLCAELDIATCVNIIKSKNVNHQDVYNVEAYGSNAQKLHNIVQKHNYDPSIESSKPCHSTQLLANNLVSSIRRIRKVPYEGQVYNIEVEEDHSYVTHVSAVHNCLRDPWMDNWVADSPVREYFHWVWMPTVDSAPQRPYWIDVFTKCDAVFTYSEFGIRTLEEQGKNKINLKGCASPGIDSNIFKPVLDKRAHRNAMGISPDINIVGTVMRNQKRKLFSELMQAFRLFLDTTDKETAKKTFLYLHTSYPEKNGWDLPELILENGISSKVLVTYICKNCKNVFVSFFADARTICKHCGQHSAIFPNVVHGATTEQLVKIFNCFDVYIQYAIAEGVGIPQIEAAACGIPIMSVDFTAMHDVVKWCKGYPIKVGYVFRELETGANRCYPDNEHLSQLLHKFFKQPNQIRKQKGFQARQGCIKRYNWDETAKKWENHFDSLELKGKQGKWDSPPEIFQPNMNVPDKMGQEQAIAWVLANIANKPQEIYKFKGMIASRDISFGATFSYGYIQEFDMKKFIAQCKAYIENKNTIEKIKAGMVGLPPADYIQAAHK